MGFGIMDGNNKKEYGDYQTPDYFAIKVCDLLRDDLHLDPKVIIEPTSGVGNFLMNSKPIFFLLCILLSVFYYRTSLWECR